MHLISLYSGIRGIARIGETELEIRQRAKYRIEKFPVPEESSLTQIRFTDFLFMKDIGTRVYLRNGRAAMIEVQDPFMGEIQGKKMKVFKLAKSVPDPWTTVLVQEFGEPESKKAGGRFGSMAFFYSWGDIAFNASGPNQMAIYRDKEIAKYRQSDFGRKITFFGDPN